MVIIAYNRDGKVVGIVNAKSEELAAAYWQGKGLQYDTKRNLDNSEYFIPVNEAPTGVYPILETIEVKAGSCRNDAKLLCVK